MKKLSVVSYQLAVKMGDQKFKKLEVWRKAMDFIEEVYKLTSTFPIKETYGLTSQLRRAAISIAMNIAEGSGSGFDTEFNRFLNISLRSSYEVMCGLEVTRRLEYCTVGEINSLLMKCDELSAMIVGLKKKLKS